MTSFVQLQAHVALNEPITSFVQLQAHVALSQPMTSFVYLQAHIALSKPMTSFVHLHAHIALSKPMSSIDQQGSCLGSCLGSCSTSLSLTPTINRPSGHWPCVRSCLVGGRGKYHLVAVWILPTLRTKMWKQKKKNEKIDKCAFNFLHATSTFFFVF